jgi:hypothetical protein
MVVDRVMPPSYHMGGEDTRGLYLPLNTIEFSACLVAL